MNAANEMVMPPSAMNPESLKILSQWLRHHGNIRVKSLDPRRLLNGRYPQGLISDAELEALLAVWH